MDPLEHYRQIICTVLSEYAQIPYAYGDIQTLFIADAERDHYLLMDVGWEGPKRVHGCLVHLQILDGKVWVQYDGTEEGVAADLQRAGIPKDHIVLGFRSPEVRPYTGYAVA
jgi:hypothetical protein